MSISFSASCKQPPTPKAQASGKQEIYFSYLKEDLVSKMFACDRAAYMIKETPILSSLDKNYRDSERSFKMLTAAFFIACLVFFFFSFVSMGFPGIYYPFLSFSIASLGIEIASTKFIKKVSIPPKEDYLKNNYEKGHTGMFNRTGLIARICSLALLKTPNPYVSIVGLYVLTIGLLADAREAVLPDFCQRPG